MTTNFNKNLPSHKCQLSSEIQRTSGETEGRRSKTSKSGQSREIGDRKKY